MFESTQPGQVEAMFELKEQADSDQSPEKVDVGLRIYRNELGQYHELRCLKKAKKNLALLNPGHDIISVQTISGTGANHLGALLISGLAAKPLPAVYIGLPRWGNYKPLFRLVGVEIRHYNHCDPGKKRVNFNACLDAVQQAPRSSIFVLQGCCHNPTGADFDREQWQLLAKEMKHTGHLPFFDIAYQGLGNGLVEDGFGVRHFAQTGFEMIVCQSFSKNFGLYGERVGALHVVIGDQKVAANLNDQLWDLIRWEFSSSPAYGSRLVNLVMDDEAQVEDWVAELGEIRARLKSN